ncbi:uncharacterized protein SCHCODRAFT_02051715 [Schizophyllum commune H4-8]|uniref:uncharacterized protein n=1 Tax=Schizophyllum commune (strain H4-8 / FGSC 9210) TaxID=578458 RepID=UPI00215FBAF4|nr:uncharacterized protein SCHCODRAFT_02051715 [Schizophyllum commune H4-8]KAI5888336.1 hypothetical protein SCHCODRAFT_02051715 [Schizophyllum commune H4-8]
MVGRRGSQPMLKSRGASAAVDDDGRKQGPTSDPQPPKPDAAVAETRSHRLISAPIIDRGDYPPPLPRSTRSTYEMVYSAHPSSSRLRRPGKSRKRFAEDVDSKSTVPISGGRGPVRDSNASVTCRQAQDAKNTKGIGTDLWYIPNGVPQHINTAPPRRPTSIASSAILRSRPLKHGASDMARPTELCGCRGERRCRRGKRGRRLAI